MIQGSDKWFSVRCVLKVGWPVRPEHNIYEERITIWRARDASQAIEKATREARDYAQEVIEAPSIVLDLAQCYELDDGLVEGAEVFSQMRTSLLEPDAYVVQFFQTGQERATILPLE